MNAIAAPTLAYKPLELNKGLGAKGGIARFPLMILTYQVVLNPAKSRLASATFQMHANDAEHIGFGQRA